MPADSAEFSPLPAADEPGAPCEAVPTLDAAALERIRALDPDGRHGVLVRVLQAFETSLQRSLQALEAASAAADLDTLARLAHTLKSSAASVGALGLSQRCAEVEAALREQRAHPDHPAVDLPAATEQILSEARRALTATAAMLRS